MDRDLQDKRSNRGPRLLQRCQGRAMNKPRFMSHFQNSIVFVSRSPVHIWLQDLHHCIVVARHLWKAAGLLISTHGCEIDRLRSMVFLVGWSWGCCRLVATYGFEGQASHQRPHSIHALPDTHKRRVSRQHLHQEAGLFTDIVPLQMDTNLYMATSFRASLCRICNICVSMHNMDSITLVMAFLSPSPDAQAVLCCAASSTCDMVMPSDPAVSRTLRMIPFFVLGFSRSSSSCVSNSSDYENFKLHGIVCVDHALQEVDQNQKSMNDSIHSHEKSLKCAQNQGLPQGSSLSARIPERESCCLLLLNSDWVLHLQPRCGTARAWIACWGLLICRLSSCARLCFRMVRHPCSSAERSIPLWLWQRLDQW